MLYFGGDPHGHFAQIERVARDAGPDDALVLLGDYDLPAPLEQVIPSARDRVWWIHGNHDCDRIEWYDHLFCSSLADRCLHARVVDVGGLRVAGLGGVFRQKVWHPDSGVRVRSREDYLAIMRPTERWRGGVPLRHRASIFGKTTNTFGIDGRMCSSRTRHRARPGTASGPLMSWRER